MAFPRTVSDSLDKWLKDQAGLNYKIYYPDLKSCRPQGKDNMNVNNCPRTGSKLIEDRSIGHLDSIYSIRSSLLQWHTLVQIPSNFAGGR